MTATGGSSADRPPNIVATFLAGGLPVNFQADDIEQ